MQTEFSSLGVFEAVRAERRLVCVRDVQEAIWVFALLVDFTHERVTLENVPSVHEEIQ